MSWGPYSLRTAPYTEIDGALAQIFTAIELSNAERINTEARSWLALGYHPADLTVIECRTCRWSWVERRGPRYPHDCPGEIDRRLIDMPVLSQHVRPYRIKRVRGYWYPGPDGIAYRDPDEA